MSIIEAIEEELVQRVQDGSGKTYDAVHNAVLVEIENADLVSADTLSDAMADSVDSYLRENPVEEMIDWDDVMGRYVDVSDEVSQQLGDYDFGSQIDERIDGLLESVPPEQAGRCSMGRQFAGAVKKVVIEMLGEASRPVRPDVALLDHGEPTILRTSIRALSNGHGDSMSGERLTLLKIVSQVSAEPQFVGPFSTTDDAAAWAQRTGRHGSFVEVETP